MIKGGMAELLSPNRCFATTHDAVRFLHREATRSNMDSESEAEREDAQASASDSDESGLAEPAPARGLAEVEQPQDRVQDVFEDACDSESEGPLAGLAPRRSHCSGERPGEAAATGSMTNDPPNTTTGRTIGSGAVGSLNRSAALSGPTVTGDLLVTQSNCPGLGQRLESQLQVHVSGCQQSTLANVTGARPGVSTSGSQAFKLPVATPATSGSGLGGNHHGPNSESSESESSSPASVSTWTPQTSATGTPRSVGTSIGVDAPRPHWQFRRLRVGPGGTALPVPDWSLIGDRPGPRGPDGDLKAPSESAITMVVPLVAQVPVPALEYAPTVTETRRGLSRAATTGAGVTQSGAPSQVGSTTTSHGVVHQREATSSSSLRGLHVKAAWTRDAEGT